MRRGCIKKTRIQNKIERTINILRLDVKGAAVLRRYDNSRKVEDRYDVVGAVVCATADGLRFENQLARRQRRRIATSAP